MKNFDSYIREKILNNMSFSIVLPDTKYNNCSKDFIEKIKVFLESVEYDKDFNVYDGLEKLNQDYYELVREFKNLGVVENNGFKGFIGRWFKDSNLSIYDIWYKDEQIFYENKKFLNVFEKIKLIKEEFGIDKFVAPINHDDDVILKAKKIIERFGLGYIVLTEQKTKKEALSFLDVCENSCAELCKIFNINEKDFGLDGKLGFAETKTQNGARFWHFKTLIEFNSQNKNLLSILCHEWMHAIDNHVYSKLFGKEERSVTTQEVFDSKIIERDFMKAYETIIEIRNDFLVSNKKGFVKIKEEKLNEAISKFFSIVFGDEWYSFSLEKKQKLYTENMRINLNLALQVNSKEDLNALIEYSSSVLSIDKGLLYKKIIENEVEIKKALIDFVKDINKVQKKNSLYYISSKINDKLFLLNNKIEDKVLYVLSFLGIKNNDKFIYADEEKTYFSRPEEMFARYFEKNIFKKNETPLLLSIYPRQCDKEFEEKKERLMSSIFMKRNISCSDESSPQENKLIV